MPDLPVGIVTFLFTDIEGSTRLLQQLGDHYVFVLTESRRLLRTAFQQWHGHEVDTQGDSFFVVFSSASDAVSAAVMAQRLLFAQSWPQDVKVRVRMGIHSGEPLLFSEGYIGLDVHCAARIMSVAYGGQVLISQATCDLVASNLPTEVGLLNVGEYLLKDLEHTIQLFQVMIPNLPSTFPPLKTLHHAPEDSKTISKSLQQSTTLQINRVSLPAVYTIAWSPDRRAIASGSADRLVRVWRSTTELIFCVYRGHTSAVTRVAWSPDGQYIASASLNMTIHVWRAMPVEGNSAEHKISSYEGHTGMISALVWSPNGDCIASSSTGGIESNVQVWNASTGRVLMTYKGHAYWVRALAWSPDGKYLASGALKEVHVWEVSTGRKIFTFHGHEGWVKAVAWSPDGTRLASTGEDKIVQVWKLGKDHSLLTYRNHNDWVGIVEWSLDSKLIASISKDHVLRTWNAATGSDIVTFHYNDDAMHAVAWLPDGKHLASVNDRGVVRIWRVDDG
ncbi:MAG TPA: adenylate/guanylate cyclase domain-containing protein [Ktedonobacteraceae bacterium]